MTVDETAKKILAKLYRHGYIGKRHTAINNVPKGFPKHLHGEIRKATKRLIRKGLIMVKPTAHGLEISLNPRKIREIARILQE